MKKVFKVLGIAIACCAVIAYLGSAYYIRGLKDEKYVEAKSLIEDCRYSEALLILKDLGEYLDAKELYSEVRLLSLKEDMYQLGVSNYNNGYYEAAARAFYAIKDYKDSEEYYTKVSSMQSEETLDDLYLEALINYEEGKYEETLTLFVSLGDYKNSEEYIDELTEILEEQS